MTSVVALDNVTSFLRMKHATKTLDVCDTAQLLAGFAQCNGGKLEEAKDFKCISSFIVC